MLEEVLQYFNNLTVDNDLLYKVVSLKPNDIDSLDEIEITKYCLILAQYLVYYKSQFNRAKAEQLRVKRTIDATVFQLMTPELIKKYKTKADTKQQLINSNIELYNMNDKLFELENEIVLADGLDGSIQEIINVLKKELKRREYELYATRYERKNK